jgi:sucrose-6F-phosphate phosphohydrolase
VAKEVCQKQAGITSLQWKAVPERILLCTDLDRTILPNGALPESPKARGLLRRLAARPEVTLAYVSGRNRELIRQAILEFEIPEPDYAIGDVGTTIYELDAGTWRHWDAWSVEIAPDWKGKTHQEVATLLSGLAELRLQEPEQQNRHKVSYYAPETAARAELLQRVREPLSASGVRASLIWSVDEAKHVALLDVLPESATKLHAVRFLMEQKGFSEQQTVFAGDSGNDLPVLTSSLQAVLVANASDEVRKEALEEAAANGLRDRLYLAQGGHLGMNGNYAAGVLEGLAHYIPATRKWMEDLRSE